MIKRSNLPESVSKVLTDLQLKKLNENWDCFIIDNLLQSWSMEYPTDKTLPRTSTDMINALSAVGLSNDIQVHIGSQLEVCYMVRKPYFVAMINSVRTITVLMFIDCFDAGDEFHIIIFMDDFGGVHINSLTEFTKHHLIINKNM